MGREFTKTKVVRWVDGDTVILSVDLGFSIWSEQKFRLARINTPERGQPGYVQAITEVNRVAPPSSVVAINCLGLDKYGRWVAEVNSIKPGGELASINQLLLDSNLATPYK